jgi:O-antigen/teichoic acid export membrane protein
VTRVGARSPTLMELIRRLRTPTHMIAHIRMVFSASIAILILNVGTGLLTARLLGPDGRGELAAIVMWPALAASLFTLGLPRAITYNLARQRAHESCLVLVGLLASLGVSLIAVLLGALLIPLWLGEYPPRIVEMAQWAMLVTPAITLLWSINGVLQARAEFKPYNRNRYLPPLLTLIGLAGLAAFGVLSPVTAALVALGSPLPPLVLNLAWIVRTHRSGFSGPVQSLRRLLSYGLRSYGMDVAGVLSKEIDRVILVGLVGPAALGIYVVARSLSDVLRALPDAVVTVLFPKASSLDAKEAVPLLVCAAVISTGIAGLLALALAVAGPVFLGLLYGEAFIPAVGPFRILLVDSVLIGFGWIVVQAFMACGKPGVVTAALLLGLAVTIPCMFLLVPALGISGAALALLISTIVRLAFAFFCFPLVLKIRLSSLWPQRPGSGWLLTQLRPMR